MEKTNQELKDVWNEYVDQTGRVLSCYEGKHEDFLVIKEKFKKAQEDLKIAIANLIDTRKGVSKNE